MLSEVLENKGNVFNIRRVWILYIDNNQKFSLSFPRREASHFPNSEEMGVFFLQMRMKRVICNGIDEILCSGYSARLFYFISPGQGAPPCAKSVRNFLHPLQTCCIQNLISKFLPVILTQTRKVRCNTSCYEYISAKSFLSWFSTKWPQSWLRHLGSVISLKSTSHIKLRKLRKIRNSF